ncbi:MAG TPA: hypothetical protein PKA51_04205, partial [Kiritimatiellia bacterium]|nr:hypothetical protein [Kiritimatiellia bacterium]
GKIHRHTREGQTSLVVTLMAPDPCWPPPSPFASRFLEMCGLGPDAGAVRRREDEAACAVLGADTLHAPFQEGNVRLDAHGQALYPDPATLFGAVRDDDQAVRQAVTAFLNELPRGTRVVAPLGIGGHVDHQIVRSAAEDVFGSDLLYYEDFPYANKWGATRPFTQPASAWHSQVIRLSAADRNARLAAFTRYESQWRMLFGSETAMRVKNRLFLLRRGGERLWRHQPGKSTHE